MMRTHTCEAAILSIATLFSLPAQGVADCSSIPVEWNEQHDAEKDTIGFLCGVQAGNSARALPASGHEIEQIGLQTGLPEKDTFGYDMTRIHGQ